MKFDALETTRHLLEAGVDANTRGESGEGQTMLHLAASFQKPRDAAMVKLLLEHGADAHLREIPKDYGPQWRNRPGDRPLLGPGETALHKAEAAGNDEAFEALLAAGADAYAMSDDGRSSLHAAASSHASAYIAGRLLGLGLDPNQKYKNSQSHPPLRDAPRVFYQGEPPRTCQAPPLARGDHA